MLLRHTNGQMHVNMIVSSIKITNKGNVFAMYNHGDLCLDLHMSLGRYLPIQLALKLLDCSLACNYEMCYILCLNKWTCTFSSLCKHYY